MVGSRLQWGRERQLSRVKLNLTCDFCREVCKTMGLALVGRGNQRSRGEFARRAMTQARLLYISKGYNKNSQSSVWERLPKLQTLNNPRSDNLYMASLPIHGSHVVESLPILLED
jgi:hypothetical protein